MKSTSAQPLEQPRTIGGPSFFTRCWNRLQIWRDKSGWSGERRDRVRESAVVDKHGHDEEPPLEPRYIPVAVGGRRKSGPRHGGYYRLKDIVTGRTAPGLYATRNAAMTAAARKNRTNAAKLVA